MSLNITSNTFDTHNMAVNNYIRPPKDYFYYGSTEEDYGIVRPSTQTDVSVRYLYISAARQCAVVSLLLSYDSSI